MYTKYDHLSPLSKSFYPKLKPKPPEVVVEEAPPTEETEGDGVSFFCLYLKILWIVVCVQPGDIQHTILGREVRRGRSNNDPV